MRRLALALAAITAAALLAAPAATAAPKPDTGTTAVAPAIPPPNGWVRREVANWIYWVPTSRWVASHNKNGIDVSSPTGDIIVSQGWASSPIPLSLPDVIAYLFDPANIPELTRLKLRRGPVTGTPGDQRQTVTWTATRQHPIKGPQAVRGSTSIHVFTVGVGAYGFQVASMMAPTNQWKPSLRTMRIVQANIRYLPS